MKKSDICKMIEKALVTDARQGGNPIIYQFSPREMPLYKKALKKATKEIKKILDRARKS